MGFAPTGKRRLYTAHTRNGRSAPGTRMNLGFSGRRACDNLSALSRAALTKPTKELVADHRHRDCHRP
jgi:hypothetical protein